jgi:hypothetical protein
LTILDVNGKRWVLEFTIDNAMVAEGLLKLWYLFTAHDICLKTKYKYLTRVLHFIECGWFVGWLVPVPGHLTSASLANMKESISEMGAPICRFHYPQKSSLDLARVKLMILHMGGQCLTLRPAGPSICLNLVHMYLIQEI